MHRDRTLITAALTLIATGTAHAQTTSNPENANPRRHVGTTSPEAAGVERFALAARLATQARVDNDPEAMLVAARTLRGVGLRAEAGPAVTMASIADNTAAASSAPTPPATVTGTRPGLSVEGLFAEARTMARGNRDLTRRIDSAAAQQSRGLTIGPQVYSREISANSYIWWNLEVRGGQVWSIAALGDGSSDVDIIIYDRFGVEVCRDFEVHTHALCSIIPEFTNEYRVEVINYGNLRTRATIVSN